MYNHHMSFECCVRRTLILVVVGLLLLLVGCGGNGRTPAEDGGGDDVRVREAVTAALEEDAAVDPLVVGTIGRVKSGEYGLEQGLDDLVDLSRGLVNQIVEISEAGTPEDTDLAEAQRLAESYLRQRVHQLESCFSAVSVEEFESLYAQDGEALQKARDSVIDKMLDYSPDLEDSLNI